MDEGRRQVRANVGVKNLGNTPATITYTLLQPYFGPSLPADPPYDDARRSSVQMSIVKTDDFTLRPTWEVSATDLQRARTQTDWHLYVIGYVDYIDKFGRRHRAGYARVYDPMADDRGSYLHNNGSVDEAAFRHRNNLPFVTQPGYNYDRERKTGEGHDWHERHP